jgi:hypothetical protein
LNSVAWATPPALFLWRVFQGRVSQTICPGWLWTIILLISASLVAGIAGVNHWHPAASCSWGAPAGSPLFPLLSTTKNLLSWRNVPWKIMLCKTPKMGWCTMKYKIRVGFTPRPYLAQTSFLLPQHLYIWRLQKKQK